MRTIQHIVLHASATIEGKHFDISHIDAWHRARGWAGVGYHYVVLLDGTIQTGRPLHKIGAHVKGHNRHSIAICYIGGLSSHRAPKDTRTPEQIAALECLIEELKIEFPSARVVGHRSFSPDSNGNGIIEPFEWIKECPCFDAEKEYA